MLHIKKHEFNRLNNEEQKKRLNEISRLFLRLGTTAFGGPAAHVAMMEDEIVTKRQWLTKEKFLDLYSATNLLPGPNSTELAIHIGYERGGWRGLVLAGVCFISPAMFIVLAVAMLYVQYGALPELTGIMYGIKPVIIAIILQAILRLAKSALKTPSAAMLAFAVIVLSFLGWNEIAILFLGGILMMIWKNYNKMNFSKLNVIVPVLPFAQMISGTAAKTISSSSIFWIFLKIGSVLYGSGYVLLAFLEADFVERLGVLNRQQLLTAISVGQFTPGPVFTTATFVGYLMQGIPGALMATAGIFLPSFLLVGLLNPLVPVMRKSAWLSGLLDGVNVASWGLMVVVTWKLGLAAFVDLPTVLLALTAMAVLMRYKMNSAWLILFGALTGLFMSIM